VVVVLAGSGRGEELFMLEGVVSGRKNGFSSEKDVR